MADMSQLANLVKELEDQLAVCMKCGMCQSVCPLFGETGRETDVARGKLALLEGLGVEMFDDPRGVSERLSRCLLCGSCAANCPSGVDVLAIFMKARAIMAGYMGLSPVKRAVLRGMLSRPGFFDRLAEWGSRFQDIFTQPVNDVVGTSCARYMSPLIGDRHFRPLATPPFHKILPEKKSQPGASGLKAAFFVGCLLDKVFPGVAEAAVRVLDHHGVGLFMPPDQACCGMPAVSSGDVQTFNNLVRHNLARFEGGGYDYLITACATCTATLRKVWPMLIRDRDLRDRVEELAGRTLDISQFLVQYAGIPPEATPAGGAATVTYHDPCHLKKTLGVADDPRALIRAHPGYVLKEMPESDRCCGLGGSFNLKYYATSARIGRKKRENIRAVDPAAVATGCPACMIQISDMLSRAGDRIAVKHPVELYAEFLDLR